MTSILLVDNGSLQPAATRQLRKIAGALGRKLGQRVEAVSLLHSNKVPAKKLGGRKAEILNPAVLQRIELGYRDFVVVPLFIGPSRALTEYIPGLVAQWRAITTNMKVHIAAPLAAAGDDRLARMLERRVRATLTPGFLRGERAWVAVVDHGSPVMAVTQVRSRVAAQLRRRLGARVAGVVACSMELPKGGRSQQARGGEPFRSGSGSELQELGADPVMSGPLLQTLLATPPWDSGPVVIAQLFLLPGRHAGPRGDVARICLRAQRKSPGLRTARTRLLGEDPALVAILADRFRAAR